MEPEPVINHRDVTTIMGYVGDIADDVSRIRDVLEDEDGEEANDEPDT